MRHAILRCGLLATALAFTGGGALVIAQEMIPQQFLAQEVLAQEVFAQAILAQAVLAQAQAPAAQPPAQAPAAAPAPGPYKPLAITLPQPLSDPSFEAFRKQLAEIAKKKDRAALTQMLAPNFFWVPEDTDMADTAKPAIDNLAKALSLDGKDASGWETLASFAAEATAMPDPQHSGAVCAPAEPGFDDKAADELANATQTDASDWVFPVRDGVEVRSAAKADAAGGGQARPPSGAGAAGQLAGERRVRGVREGDDAVRQDRLRADRDRAADRRRAAVLPQGRQHLEDRRLLRRRSEPSRGRSRHAETGARAWLIARRKNEGAHRGAPTPPLIAPAAIAE